MIGKIIGVMFIMGIISVAAWVVMAFLPEDSDTKTIDLPDSNKATHSVYIENTGNLLLTSDYEAHGTEVGGRTYILHGFWEASGNDFVYRSGDIVLNEASFGEITIKRR